ncbi:MAG: alkaline phosphatase [Pirellulales bacterium]
MQPTKLWRLKHSCFGLLLLSVALARPAMADHIKDLQTRAKETGRADWGYWGGSPDVYFGWKTHSNRLIPVYAYGQTLASVSGENSLYRNEAKITSLFGQLPKDTVNPNAEYFDQTDVYRLQTEAFAAGKKHVILLIFDGMDWQTTWAAAIHRAGQVKYRQGPGSGLFIQDYRDYHTTASDFGFVVTSPHNHGTGCNVDAQTVTNPGGSMVGGFCAARGGATPWANADPAYLMGTGPELFHAVTDSASAGTSLMAGIKTYNDGINVDSAGKHVAPLGQTLQARGLGVGVVTSVPISHATPACAYANNVNRDDYQDLTRDLIGLPSISHRGQPLPGVDVLIGAGWGESSESDAGQGTNFIPGNRYMAEDDLAAINVEHGGKYQVAQRTAGRKGTDVLVEAAQRAIQGGQRLLGYFGTSAGHLPFQTADGKYDPVPGVKAAEVYSEADVLENPTLADMTRAALTVLEQNPKGFWLMVEAGDVDWANHDDNLDNSIGAVLSGDDAFRAIVEWVERHKAWDDTVVLITADHGHMLNLSEPEALLPPGPASPE